MLPPRDYQTQGCDFLVARNKAILADDAGLGKSRTAIMAADRLGLNRRLIICPAIGRLTWPAEIKRWQSDDSSLYVIVLEPGAPVPHFPDRCTVIVAFDTISHAKRYPDILRALTSYEWDLVVIDEGQRLANPGSNRTRLIYGDQCDAQYGAIIEKAKRVWVLTGTPTPNHAGELYPHARALFPAEITYSVRVNGSADRETRPLHYHEFIELFCRYRDTTYGRAITGSKNQDELRQRMKNVILRRRKQDVLKELPPLDFVAVPVPPDRLVPLPTLQVPPDLSTDDMVGWLQSNVTQLSSLRREMGMAKVLATAQWVEELLLSGTEKVLVFAHHRDVVHGIARELANFNAVTVLGGIADNLRSKAISDFQTKPETKVFVGQIDACGVAITLTAAHDVVFAECSWVPGANYQAASRAHRLGQQDGVLARFLYVPNSLDERIMTTFQRKAKEISELWD